MACILLWSCAVRVHDSQAYRKMDVTREHISRILELREILLSIQIGLSLVNAAVAHCYTHTHMLYEKYSCQSKLVSALCMCVCVYVCVCMCMCMCVCVCRVEYVRTTFMCLYHMNILSPG